MSDRGTFGNTGGAINEPVFLKIDRQDNVYVLQNIRYGDRNKRVVSIYDKNLDHVRTFDVVKKSLSLDGVGESTSWAGKGMYTDVIAESLDVGMDGRIYILSGYEVLVFESDGRYKLQFPVSGSMTWIENTTSGVTFVRPSGISVNADNKIYVTTGQSRNDKAVLAFDQYGKPLSGILIDANQPGLLYKDMNDNDYLVESKTSRILEYDCRFGNPCVLPIFVGGTGSEVSSIATFSDGRVIISADGLFLFEKNGTFVQHFINNESVKDTFKGRKIAVNSTDHLIVASPEKFRGNTTTPFAVYRYSDTGVTGRPGTSFLSGGDGCALIPLAPFYLLFDGLKLVISAF